MAGWSLKKGIITEYYVDEERIWSLFNFVFSDSSRKRNSYKFGFIKSLLDNIFNGSITQNGIYYSYEELFSRFAENYWNLVVKYDLRQMRKDKRSTYSKIETIFISAVQNNPLLSTLEFECIDKKLRDKLIKQVVKECKKCVVGALYEDFDGIIYEFDSNKEGLILNHSVHDFLLKYKTEIEYLNYYSWAKFLEQVNNDNSLIRVIDKLELATPKRKDLTPYREILRKEYGENNCFYCDKELKRTIHVDHFIPWSFVKDDKMWNFVLACPDCNKQKNNRIAPEKYLSQIIKRNHALSTIQNEIVKRDFEFYSDDLLRDMWHYAKISGFKAYDC